MQALLFDQPLLALFFFLTNNFVLLLLSFDLLPQKPLLLLLVLNRIELLLCAYSFCSFVAGEHNLQARRADT